MSDHNAPARKIGQGHAMGVLRLGFHELQSAMYTGSNVAREPGPGMIGHPTQGEIAADRRPDVSPSIMDTHSQDARAQSRSARERGERESPGHEPPAPERE